MVELRITLDGFPGTFVLRIFEAKLWDRVIREVGTGKRLADDEVGMVALQRTKRLQSRPFVRTKIQFRQMRPM